MPRINQLPAASSVAQTDVLAIDTPDKTYKVPRSILAPDPYIATIPTGQWSGSGSDRYITVTASNVTADAMLYPFYDNASAALLNGPVWAIPADGSFTIHTSAIPSGTVTISVLLAGIVGEAQYQVLADVYSKSQVDSIVSQSTATLHIGGNMAGLACNDERINIAVPYQGPAKTAVSANKTSNISGNIYGDKSLVRCTFTIQDLKISDQKVVYFNLLPSVTLSTYQNLGRVMMVDLSEPITLTLS